MLTSDLTTLDPVNVWKWFADICAIPHPTFHERKLGEYILAQVNGVGKKYGLTGEMDHKGNIRIHKPASNDMREHVAVAIQAHYDMVAQKGNESTHDFIKDPIQTCIKDGWVWANDTTLGADNGIGLAMALAVAFSDDISHPPLTLIITSEEEIGMGGVQALNPAWLDMDYLINLDSEDEGTLFVGCAGGRDATFTHNFELLATDSVKEPLNAMTVSVSGLHGGHSGIDIHRGFANANLVLARILSAVYDKMPFYLASFEGGVLRNVITREAQALIFGDTDALHSLIAHQVSIIKKELNDAEPNLAINLNQHTDLKDSLVIGLADSQRVLDMIRAIPNGVLRMSDSFEGVVETSISMGVVKLEAGNLSIYCLMRSLGETPKDDVSQRLNALARLSGMSLELSDDYPGWQPATSSYLLSQAKPIVEKVFDNTPKIEVIHAGLECGLLSGKAPHLDLISFGPTIRGAHSPKERVEIKSVTKTWDVLLKLLKSLPVQSQ